MPQKTVKWYRNIQGKPTHRRPFLLNEQEVFLLACLAIEQQNAHDENGVPITDIPNVRPVVRVK